jgi:hypothetical protein
MGTLIIGGLLVIALLAIVGSIFAARGGTTGNVRRTPAPKAADSEMRVEAPPVETPSQPEEPVGQALPPTLEVVNNGHDEPLAPTTPLAEEQPLYNANGQVHELTAQLQALHEEARHLSQRLSILTEMAEHIEERQSNHAEGGM